MSIISTAAGFLLTGIELAFPEAAPIIEVAKRAEPLIEAGIPLIKAAITEGPGAFAAAKVAAPDLFNALQSFANATKAQLTGDPKAVASDHEVANLAAHAAGIDPPGWTHEATQRWWGKAKGND